MKRIVLLIASVAFCGAAAGCSRNPNVEIVGSYFPAWMISLVLAVCLTGAAHVLLRQAHIDASAGHPAILYPAMVTLFTCVLWLCFFS